MTADVWYSFNGDADDDADAYLLLDQDQALLAQEGYGGVEYGGRERADGGGAVLHQMQLMEDSSEVLVNGWSNELLSTDPGSSSLQAEQQQTSSKHKGSPATPPATTAAGGGGKCKTANVPARKCTTLAQREAHKRYREKKKQNIAAMEAEVQTKRDELLQLQAENEALKSKARVLETAERCSVEIHELMQLLDILQGLPGDDDVDTAGGGQSGNDCCSSRDMTAAAAGQPSSQQGNGLPPAQAPAAAAASAAAAAAAADDARLSAPQQPSSGHNPFLQTLMHGASSTQQQAPAGMLSIKPEPQHHQQQSDSTRLSLQDEAHWLQMAQQYVDMQQQQQHAAAQPACAQVQPVPPHQGNAAPPVFPARTAVHSGMAAGAAGAAAVAKCETPSGSNISRSCTAESGSSVLADLGSVDTAEQGLVIYKAFLQKASEMLALAQQQKLQAELDAAAATDEELGVLTRSTISRLQPFLIARGQGVVYDWNARNLDTQQPEEPPASLWPAVLDALHLTPDTQRDALHCFDLFGAPLASLLEQRTQLAQKYRELQAHKPKGASSSSSKGDVLDVTAARTLEAVAEPMFCSMAVLKALAANLERYQSLDGVFAHSLTNLLTGAQIAAACVASYPYLPRWHSLMASLKQRKEQEQHGVQHIGHGSSAQPQRRSTRVRTATRQVKEAAYV